MRESERDYRRALDAKLADLLDMEPEARAQWLQARALEAADEARDLRRLLAQAETAGALGGLREQPVLREAWATVTGIGPGSRLGDWRLGEQIGAGGMAQVFRAERERSGVTQQAALKLMAAHLGGDALVERFRAEQVMLARLSDARIARFYDSGVAPDGRPWMAMEFVDGRPIDVWCREHELDIAARLKLMRSVAGAVAHAHRHLIVHRDIKPSNVLVDAAGQVKLLDFGIAKPIDAGATDLTASGARPLTPIYASPEQLRGEPIATTSDVFQTGLLLFELLVGQRPFAQYEHDSFLLEQALREHDMPRPSDVLLQRAKLAMQYPDAGENPAVLRQRARRVRGDLDRIALMALSNDPARRYASMEQFDEDLARHLDGEPVRARPDSLGYRMSKWAGRHRFLSGAIAAGLVVAIASAAALLQQNREIRHERDIARTEAAKATAIKQFLLDLIAEADPGQALGEKLDLGTVLSRGGKRIDAAFAQQPVVRGELLTTLAGVYRALGNYEEAGRLAAQAVELPTADAARARALALQAAIARDRGDLDRAISTAEAALALAGTDADAQAQAWFELGVALLMHEGEDYARAGAALEASITAEMRSPDPDPVALAITRGSLAIVAYREQRYDDAERGYRHAIDVLSQRLGEQHPEVTSTLYNLARLQEQQQRWSEAETTLRRVLDAERTVLGDEHPDVAIDRTRLGFIQLGRGDAGSARASFAQALASLRAALPGNHKRIAENLMGYAEATLGSADAASAESLIDESLGILREHFPPDDWRVAEAMRIQARVWIHSGRRAQARAQLARIGPILAQQPSPYSDRYAAAVREAARE